MPVERITLCMIARDESAVITRCLDSFAGAFDELCVVDTGSVDDTPLIATRRGAEVVSCTDCNGEDGRIVDFSSARNRYLDRVATGWVLQADADEILLSDPRLIREAVARGNCDTVGVELESAGARWCSVRLFRRAAVNQYVGRVHEIMLWSMPRRYFEDRRIKIRNVENKGFKESGSSRNIRLCKAELNENPSNYRLLFYLGSEYFKLGEHATAADCFRKVLDSGGFRIGHFHAAYYIGAAAMVARDWDGAIAAGETAISIDDGYAEGYCLVADAHFLTGRLDAALQYYRRALRCVFPPPGRPLAVQEWAYRAHPEAQIARMEQRRQAEVTHHDSP